MTALATSFVFIALAEMADKTQLLTLCLTCRYPARKVLLGVTLAIALLNLVAVGIGGLAGSLLPVTPVKVAAGVLFIGFGLWTLLSGGGDETEEECDTRGGRSVVLAVALAFLVAELGDKTQLAALSLAARFGSFFLVWLGATLGMVLANALAVGGGNLLGSRLPQRTLMRLSAVLFVIFGLWTLAAVVIDRTSLA
jgi:putative Ca2+/H+ antiporter (TMEM165/GDT1 family)